MLHGHSSKLRAVRAINGFEALHIGITRGILGQRLRNARPPPSSSSFSSKMLRSTLSLSLSPPPLPRQSPRPPLPTQTVGVDDAVGQRCRAGAFVRPTPTSLLPPLFTLPLHSRSLSRSLLPPPPAAPTPPLRFAHLPRTDVPDQPLLPPRFLSFFPSFSLLRPARGGILFPRSFRTAEAPIRRSTS